MKKITRAATAAVAAIALALLPAMSASAAATQTATITQDWGYQYTTLLNPAKTIQAVIDYENDAVYLVDLASHAVTQVTDSAATFSDPYRAAFTPDGAHIYVSNYTDDSLSVIDVATATVVGTFVTTNSENTAVGVSPDGTRLVTTDDYGYAYLYDLSNADAPIGSGDAVSNEIIGVYFPSSTTALLVDEYGYLYTMNLTDGSVSSRFGDGLSSYEYGVCASKDVSTVYIPGYYSSGSGSLFAIDAVSGSVSTIDLSALAPSDGYFGCDVSDNNTIFVSDEYHPAVVVVDGATKTPKSVVTISGLAPDTIVPPSYPNGVANGINAISDCSFIVDGYYGNAAIVDACEAALPNTGVDTVVMSSAAAGGLALVALGALAVVLVRRRATR
jgi:LPXTG-motif cell wall-anchored protein